ncbi:MAG: VWA domain-containing protein [Planctomycetes bacterium]|nr:VWA domain-containing protein [Planctomycetota bacterium]MCB9910987.1 VWA domain-containing protein [Planctomycetota bacterium]HPF14089.1 vWA domain-containing protein [Planctomycetota bacterium]
MTVQAIQGSGRATRGLVGIWLGLVGCLLLGLPGGLLMGTAWAQEGSLHGSLAHGSNPRGTPPVRSSLSRKWQVRVGRMEEDLVEPAGRDKALGRMLQTLVDQEAKCAGLAGAKGRKLEEREELQQVVRYLEGVWRGLITSSKSPWAGSWLVQQALGATKDRQEQERALDLLVDARQPDAKTLVLLIANQSDHPLRLAALRAMCHWPAPEFDRFLVHGYCQHTEALGWTQLLLHRVQAHGVLDPSVADEWVPALGAAIASLDWQASGSAILLTRGLEPEKAVVALVRAMPAVAQGVEEGKVRWRILSNLGAELRRLTGRAMGPDPRQWQTFLDRFLAGQLPLRAEVSGDGDVSQVEFFGVGKVSDHVTFVLDTSGSMQAPFGTTGHSAYEEAVDQLIQYLERMGPNTWFEVVAFSSDADAVFPLAQADERTLKVLRDLMDRRNPDGGTELGKGVDLALERIAKESSKDRNRASDTIVVLCDGATQEGRAWVEQRLSEPDFPMGLRFYCVQIGAAPSDAMRALAELTGGRFVRI